MRSFRVKLILLACLSFVVAVAVATAATPRRDNPTGSSAKVASATRASRQHRASPALIRSIALFTGADKHGPTAHAISIKAEPPSVQRLLKTLQAANDPSNRSMLLDASQTREVDAGPSTPVWAIPGGAGACVVAAEMPRTERIGQLPADGYQASVAGCDPTSVVQRQGILAISSEPSGGHLVFGIVPNGNQAVTVTEPSGATLSLPVVDNAVSAVVPDFPSTLQLQSATGTTITLHP